MSGPYRETDAGSIRALADALIAAGERASFRHATDATVAATLAAAVDRLVRDAPLHERLASSTGLSQPMVAWALRTTAAGVRPEHVTRLRQGASAGWHTHTPSAIAPRSDLRLIACVLSGNVFTAAIRAIALPLVYGVPVLVKASSRDDVLPRAFRDALSEELREGVGIVTYPGGTSSLDEALLARADSVHVYGSDETCRALRALAPPQASFVAHGHGTGVGLVLEPLDECLPAAAEALALDIAAYDQRGCLSPHEVYVAGTPRDARRLADALHLALTEIERQLPRGAMPLEVSAAASQWKGTVASLGALLSGPSHAIAVEVDTSLPRGPGWRHVVLRARAPSAIDTALTSLGHHLKAIGCTAGGARRAPPRGTFARLSPLGQMQTPPLDAWLDGLPPWEGMLRVSRFDDGAE